jgi:hypothetical protein
MLIVAGRLVIRNHDNIGLWIHEFVFVKAQQVRSLAVIVLEQPIDGVIFASAFANECVKPAGHIGFPLDRPVVGVRS